MTFEYQPHPDLIGATVSFFPTLPDSSAETFSLLLMASFVDVAQLGVEPPRDVTSRREYKHHSRKWYLVRCWGTVAVLTTSRLHRIDLFVVGDVSIEYVPT